MPDPEVLQQLLFQCAREDRDAFSKLYQLTSAKLFSFLLRILKKPDLAEDALQEIFLKIWHRAADYRPDRGAPINWMMRITRNHALDRLRRKAREPRSEEPPEWEQWLSPDAGPADQASNSADIKRFVECLDELQDEQRKSLLLAYYYGYTHDELAETLQAPLGTVKSWVRRGLQRVKACIEQ